MAKQNEIKNLAASVKARLFNYARENGKDFQGVFRLYVQERFLYRLSKKEAIMITFKNRKTDLSDRSAVFSLDFKKDKSKQLMWSAFLNQHKLKSESEFEKVIKKLESFIEPVFQNGNLKWNPKKFLWE